MMTIKLPNHLIEKLCVLPENGNGYQRVKIAAKGEVIGNLIVEQCQNLYLPSTLKLASEDIDDVELDSTNIELENFKKDKKMSKPVKMKTVPKVGDITEPVMNGSSCNTLPMNKENPVKITVVEKEVSPKAELDMPLIGGGGLLKILEKVIPLLTQIPTKSFLNENPLDLITDEDLDADDPVIQEFKKQGGFGKIITLINKSNPIEAKKQAEQIYAAVSHARLANRLNILRQTFSVIQRAGQSGLKQAQAVEALDVLIADATSPSEAKELKKAKEAVLAGTPQHIDAAKYRVKNVFASYVHKPNNIRTAYTSLSTQVNEPCLMCPKGNYVWGYPVPMEISKCRDNCIDSRVDHQGVVSCAYSNWLKHADSQEAVLSRLDTIRHPDNEASLLTLKPGERAHKLGPLDITYNQRMEEAKLYTDEKNQKQLWDKSRETQLDEASEANLGHHGDVSENIPSFLERNSKTKVNRIDSESSDTIGTQISKSFHDDLNDQTWEQMLNDEHVGLTEKELNQVMEIWLEEAEDVWEKREQERKHKQY